MRIKYINLSRTLSHALLGLAALLFLVSPVGSASLNINASGGSVTISQGGVYNVINITGATSPTLDISSRLTLVGSGTNTGLIITGASSAFLNAVNTTLSLGSATNMKGGLIRGDIKLDNSTLRVYGSSTQTPLLYYTLGAAGNATGKIEGDGRLELRADAILNSGAVGSEKQALSSISIGNTARLNIRDGLWADNVNITGGNLSAISGDIHIKSLDLSGTAPSLQANTGDIYLGTVNASSPSDELFSQAGIYSEQGNVNISGELNLEKGLTSITAAGDIVFGTGDASVGGNGELYVKAGGNVSLNSAKMSNSHLQALKISITGDLEAKNVLAAQLSAGTVNIGENLEIQGNSVQIFGNKVAYGDLSISGKGGKIGGDLGVYDAQVNISDLTVGKNAIFSAVRGTFDSLKIAQGLDFSAGELAGNSLQAKNILLGESEYVSTLSLKKLSFNSLHIGKLGTVKTEILDSPHGSLALANGGSLELASGDMGTKEAPLSSISLSGSSALNAPGSIYAASLAGSTGTNKLSAKGDILISGAITGGLYMSSEGDIGAESIAASDIQAKNVEIDGGTLKLSGTGDIENDLTISGRLVQERMAGTNSAGYFNELHVGGTMTLSASDLYGNELAAGTLLVGNSVRPTHLAVGNIVSGFGLGVGKNAFVSLGESSSIWLSSILANNAKTSVTSALGVAKAVKLGPAGLTVNPAEALPTPARGEVNFAPESMLVVYGPNAREDKNPEGMISADSPLTAHVQDGAKLLLSGVVANHNYGVLGENITTHYENDNAWNDSNVETDSHLIGLKKIPGYNGWFSTVAKAPDTVYPDLDPGLKPPLEEGTGGSGSNSVPATPIEPANPTRPNKPSSPSENPGSGSPSAPSTPSQNPGASTPSSPSNPSEPSDNPGNAPSQPSAPNNPATNPSTPTRPDTPSTPSENPGASTSSTPSQNPDASTPSTPSNPSAPADNTGNTPSQPSAPNEPTTNPSTPARPETPSTPSENPGTSTSSTPSQNPGTSTPSTPSNPSTPADNPGNTPSQPSAPNNPATNPSSPARPETPSTPSENPGTSTPSTPSQNPGASTPSTPSDNPDNTPSRPGEADEPSTGPDAPAETDTPSTPADNPGESQEPAEEPVQEARPAEPALGTENKYFYSDYAGVRFLSRVTSTRFMAHDYDLAWKTIEAAARMAILGAVPQMAYSANMGAVDAAEGRAIFMDKAAQMSAVPDGHSWGLWLVPMYRNLQGYNLQAYDLDYNFSGALGGIVLGADYTLGDDLRFGIDASIGGGYAKSSGDLAKTTNDMGFSGIGIYGGWLPGNFGLSADVHYTWTWNSLKQEFPASLDMKDPTGELTARVLSAGLRAEYRIPFDNWQIVPHAAVRYAHVHTDNYSIYSGGAMIDGQAIEQNIWTYPLGIEFRADFVLDSGWEIKPSLDFLLTPAAGDIYATTKLNFTGVPGEANIDTQTMDYLRYGGSVGFIARKDNFNFGLDYKIQRGWRGTEQSVFGTFCYEF